MITQTLPKTTALYNPFDFPSAEAGSLAMDDSRGTGLVRRDR